MEYIDLKNNVLAQLINERIDLAIGTVKYASTNPATNIRIEDTINKITACFSLVELSLKELTKISLADLLS